MVRHLNQNREYRFFFILISFTLSLSRFASTLSKGTARTHIMRKHTKSFFVKKTYKSEECRKKRNRDFE
jgi:hypothetical protein